MYRKYIKSKEKHGFDASVIVDAFKCFLIEKKSHGRARGDSRGRSHDRSEGLSASQPPAKTKTSKKPSLYLLLQKMKIFAEFV